MCTPVIPLRIAVIPQRWTASRGYVRGFGVHQDVVADLPDLHALGDKRYQAHLVTAYRQCAGARLG